MTWAQLAALASLQLYRRLYLATLPIALAAGLNKHVLASDVCDLGREAGVVLDTQRVQ